MIRRLNVPVPVDAVLERMVGEARPLAMSAGRSEYGLLRKTYFDTTDGALRDRRTCLYLRQEASGRRTLNLVQVTAVSLEGILEEVALEEGVVCGGLYETLCGASELATRVREFADPVALRPMVALDVDREVRGLKARRFGRTTHRITFDRMVAHGGNGSHPLHEVTLEEIAPGPLALEALAERLRDGYGLATDGLDSVERARRALGGPPGAMRGDGPHEVAGAAIILRNGAVALRETDEGLTLPLARGSGEELARRFIEQLVLESAPEFELVGFAQGRQDRPDLELWLHELRLGAEGPPDSFWLPLPELLGRVGSPRLRSPDLIAALLLLVRSEIGRRLLTEFTRRRTRPSPIPPGPRDPEAAPGEAPDDLLDGELSILDFNQRVLELAEDASLPLLERFRFLSIFASNLDEFFVVRVGRLKMESRGPESEQEAVPLLLDMIAIRTRALIARQYACLSELTAGLDAAGTRIRRWRGLDAAQREALSDRFDKEIFPLLTPRSMSAAPGHPFPRLASLGLSLATVLRAPGEERPHLAHIPIPEGVPRFLTVQGTVDLILVEDVIEANAADLFPGWEVLESHPFRVSRLGDVEIDEEIAESFLASIADEVEARPYKPVVRIEVHTGMPREMRAHLLRELRAERGGEIALLGRSDIFEIDGPVDLTGFSQLALLNPELGVFPNVEPHDPLDADRSIFDIITEGDVLVHHPFESFEATVGRLLREAANDPDVVSIKLTLYRTGRESTVVETLLDALRNGKEVTVFVELKARFDEESNIQWTHRLREAGGHVVYGVVGFKTHAKTTLIVRREAGGVRRYVHVGTGNYNAATARFYTDLGLMSADPDLGADLNDFFNELTGSAGPPTKEYRRLWVAPASLVTNLMASIEREVEHARAGRPARIQAKMNGITDRKVVKALYRAARSGVQIDLVVRAICTVRPGVPGLSENVRVRSILGRFLEHARIYAFLNGGDEEFYIGSADWRLRNLRKRVEVIAPVRSSAARTRLRTMLDAELNATDAWILRADGAYERGTAPDAVQSGA